MHSPHNMDVGNPPNHAVAPSFHISQACVNDRPESSSHPLQTPLVQNDNFCDHPVQRRVISFVGPSFPSDNQAAQGPLEQIHPTQSRFPLQQLRGPGQTGRSLSPSPDRSSEKTPWKRQRTISPEPVIHFTERKTTAYDVWLFVRALQTAEEVPQDLWPSDYGKRLSKRPDTSFVGCKFCTHFG